MLHDLNLQWLDWLAVGILAVQLVLIGGLVRWALRLDRADQKMWNQSAEGGGYAAPAPLLAGWYGYGISRAMADLNGANMRAVEGEQ